MALSESRRKKLEMLTRSLAKGDIRRAQEVLRRTDGDGAARPSGAEAASGQTAAGTPGRSLELGPTMPRGPVALEQAVPGVEQALSRHGRFWLVRRTLAQLSGDYLDVQRQYAAVLRGARQRFDELAASPGLCHVANGAPESPLFMDLETCGLAGMPIFLVGLMSYQRGELVFEQFLARHYGEEPAILAAFADRLAASSVLVTFNGKSFDMNSVRDRSIVHRLELGDEPPHCDLLHEARRSWRGLVPNCRLQTLEQYLCKRRRVDDIPSAAIPDAYHRFVASGDAGQLGSILHHNLLDLLTMSQLLCALLTGEQPVSEY